MASFQGKVDLTVTNDISFNPDTVSMQQIENEIRQVFKKHGLLVSGVFNGNVISEELSLRDVVKAKKYRFFVCPLFPDMTDEEGEGYEIDLNAFMDEAEDSDRVNPSLIVKSVINAGLDNYVIASFDAENPVENALDECSGDTLVLAGYGEYPRGDRYGTPSWDDGAGFVASVAEAFAPVVICGDPDEIFYAVDSGDDSCERQYILIAQA